MHTHETHLGQSSEKYVLAAIVSSGLFTALGIGLFAFTIPLVSLDEKISGAWLGTAFAGYYLAKLLVAPLSGAASDHIGPKRILIFAMLSGSLTPLLYFIAPDLTTLYAIQVAMGIIMGLIRPVAMAALGGSATGEALSRRFALYAAVFNGAAFIGPILGSLLYFNRSMEPVLLALAFCMGLATLVTAFLLPQTTTTKRQGSTQDTESPVSKEKTGALLFAIAGRTIGIGFMTAFYPIFLVTTLGHQDVTIALLYATPGLATFIGLSLSGRLSSKQADIDRVALGMLLSAGSLFAISDSTQPWQFITFGIFMGLGAALSIPASMTLASALTRKQGTMFGATNLASGIGLLAGPLLGGIIVQSVHSLVPAIQTTALIGALSCLPLLSIILCKHFHWSVRLARGATTVIAIVLVIIMNVCLLPGDSLESPQSNLYKYTDVAMGTIVNITIEAKSRRVASEAAKKTISAMRTLQQDFDHRNANGSIGRINHNAGKAWVKPTPRAFALLERALSFSAKSQGVFDPTIGAFTTSPLYFALDKQIAHTKSDLVDYQLVLLDRPSKRVRLKKRGMALDLGGIAKGTIVDAAVALLRGQGIRAGIVEAGGDFYCFGERDWTVGIRHPRNSAALQTVSIREKGVCGSGDYQQFITTEENGHSVTQHHIIDPSTMESARESIGVTVIANSAEEADALATTLFIMGPKQGMRFLEQYSPDSASIWFLPNHSATITKNFPL